MLVVVVGVIVGVIVGVGVGAVAVAVAAAADAVVAVTAAVAVVVGGDFHSWWPVQITVLPVQRCTRVANDCAQNDRHMVRTPAQVHPLSTVSMPGTW